MATAYLMVLKSQQRPRVLILSSKRPTIWFGGEQWKMVMSMTAETYEKAREKLLTFLEETKFMETVKININEYATMSSVSN